MDLLLDILGVLLILAVLAALAVRLYFARQGNCKFVFLVSERSGFKLTSLTKESATFVTVIPFANKGTQDGTIVDLFPRHLLPQEQFDAVKTESYLAHADFDRADGYWEAMIIPFGTGGKIKLTVKFTAKEGDIVSALAGMVDMPIELICQTVGRSYWQLGKTRLIMPKEEVKEQLKEMKETSVA